MRDLQKSLIKLNNLTKPLRRWQGSRDAGPGKIRDFVIAALSEN